MERLILNMNNEENKQPDSIKETRELQKDFEQLANKEMSIPELLIWATEHNCSDLYITVEEHPYVSRFGKLTRLECPPVSKTKWQEFADNYISNELHAVYVREKALDESVEIYLPKENPNQSKYFLYRYRASYGFSKERNIATFRMIRPTLLTFETINFNPKCVQALRQAFAKPTGIIFFTGPTGSGKSTTLAACVNTFSQKKDLLDNKVIITLEDPIENEFADSTSVHVMQKELGRDFKSFPMGIKEALREHPNVIIVGECRDKEVICTTIEAARTGHLTTTSFHADTVSGTIGRLLYHLDNDKNLSLDLLLQLNIIVSQKMIKQEDKYLVDTQYLLFTDEITDQLVDVLISGGDLAKCINELIHNYAYQERGWAKDWDYKELHTN